MLVKTTSAPASGAPALSRIFPVICALAWHHAGREINAASRIASAAKAKCFVIPENLMGTFRFPVSTRAIDHTWGVRMRQHEVACLTMRGCFRADCRLKLAFVGRGTVERGHSNVVQPQIDGELG